MIDVFAKRAAKMDLEIFRKLGELGAAYFQHLNVPRTTHLEGTYQYLKALGNRRSFLLRAYIIPSTALPPLMRELRILDLEDLSADSARVRN